MALRYIIGYSASPVRILQLATVIMKGARHIGRIGQGWGVFVTSDLFVISFRSLQGPPRLDLGFNEQNVDLDFNQARSMMFVTCY